MTTSYMTRNRFMNLMFMLIGCCLIDYLHATAAWFIGCSIIYTIRDECGKEKL